MTEIAFNLETILPTESSEVLRVTMWLTSTGSPFSRDKLWGFSTMVMEYIRGIWDDFVYLGIAQSVRTREKKKVWDYA